MWKLGALLFLVFLQAQAATYNFTQASRFTAYAGAAYCVPQNQGAKVQSWTCGYACNKITGMNTSTIILLRNRFPTDASGYVGYNYLDNAIVVAFSGTDPFAIRMWLDDAEATPVDYPPCASQGCKVHKGFYDTYLALQNEVWNAVGTLIKAFPNAKIQVTGHSLGAALTVHGALDIALHFGKPVDVVYNFGQPRVGNANFSDFYEQYITHFRLTHYKDWVPHEPTYNWGYHSEFTEIYYNEPQSQYTVCASTGAYAGEDPTCGDQWPEPYGPVEIVDTTIYHLDYIGFDFTDSFLDCDT
jgi:hypothetical protein